MEFIGYILSVLGGIIIGVSIAKAYLVWHLDGVFYIDDTSNKHATICKPTLKDDPAEYLKRNQRYMIFLIEESTNLQSILYPEDTDLKE